MLKTFKPLEQTTPVYEVKEPPKLRPVFSYGAEYDPKVCLRNCPIGKSFVVDTAVCRRRVIDAAYSLEIKVKTKKNKKGRYDCWRMS
jgi:hypothetical protein